MDEMNQDIIITIDGGAASGKSSTSRLLAEKLNLLHVDTGSHYRSITCYLLQTGCEASDLAKIEKELKALTLNTEIQERNSLLLLNDQRYEASELRSDAVNAQVSHFAAIPAVREKLLMYQRSQVQVAIDRGFSGLVMEGRDIGSVVLPDAPYRFYLEADAATRQARRAKEGQQDTVLKRDQLDSSRKQAPMKIPEGAIRIDTSRMTLEAVVELIFSRIK